MRTFLCCDCGTIHQREIFSVTACGVCAGSCVEQFKGEGNDRLASYERVYAQSGNCNGTVNPLSGLIQRGRASFSQVAVASSVAALLFAGAALFVTSDQAMAKCQETNSYDACFTTLHR